MALTLKSVTLCDRLTSADDERCQAQADMIAGTDAISTHDAYEKGNDNG
jgi:hypothetical protein